MATARQWVSATRPRTLPAAIVPVIVGLSIASAYGQVHWLRVVLTLFVSLSIQVGTNFANDFSDGVRGTDTRRSGPTRLVGGGLASPKAVLYAALSAFFLAGLIGLYVALITSLYVLVAGAASIAAGWFYTGGRHPYGYAGYGEIFVFVFFGLVSVVGSTYVISGAIPAISYLVAVPVGLLTVALLVINNLRDIPTDAQTGKHTLAVRIGDPRTRLLYGALIGTSFALVVPIALARPFALLALLAVAVARMPVALVRTGHVGAELIPALAGTGALMMSFGLLLALGIAI